MPRPHQPRSLGREDNLAARVARERTDRGLSYEGLAKLMTEAGCPMQGSAIYKIEKGSPRRRISVDELVAFTQVFETTVDDLLTPVEVLDEKRVRELLDEMNDADHALFDAIARIVQTYAEFLSLAGEDTDLFDFAFGHRFPGRRGDEKDVAPTSERIELFTLDDVPGYDTEPFSREIVSFLHRAYEEAGSVVEATLAAGLNGVRRG